MNHSAAVLGASRDREAGLEGDYFTDPDTRGELRFSQHFRKLIETYDQGRALADEANR